MDNSYDLTRKILYDLSKPQWRVGLGARLGVGHFYKFKRMATCKIRTIQQKSYEFVQVRSYEFIRISHLVKYLQIIVRSFFESWTTFNLSTVFLVHARLCKTTFCNIQKYHVLSMLTYKSSTVESKQAFTHMHFPSILHNMHVIFLSILLE